MCKERFCTASTTRTWGLTTLRNPPSRPGRLLTIRNDLLRPSTSIIASIGTPPYIYLHRTRAGAKGWVPRPYPVILSAAKDLRAARREILRCAQDDSSASGNAYGLWGLP